MEEQKWLKWCRALQGVSQTGLFYAKNPGEVERYNTVKRVAAEMLSQSTSATVEYIETIFDKNVGYATPQVTVRGVIFNNSKVLLVKERKNKLWTLPGGYAEINDSPAQSVIREIKEETGYDVKANKLLAVYDSVYKQIFHRYNLFFSCEIIGGNMLTNDEIEEIAFFELDEIKELHTFPNIYKQIVRFYELYLDACSLTDFY